MTRTAEPTIQRRGVARAVLVVSEPVAREPFCGRTLLERHAAVLARLGIVDVQTADAAPSRSPEPLLVVAAERVFDPRLYAAALEAGGPVRLVDDGVAIGLEVLGASPPVDLDVSRLEPYSRELRRAIRPYWLSVRSTADRDGVRRALVAASGKGHQEVVARVVHAPIEAWLASRLAATRVTPNQLTLLCNLLAYAVVPLFATGRFGAGVALAMIAGVVDGLDGRQARVQAKTSELGRVEHLLDKVYEILWIGALAYGVSGGFADQAALAWLAVWIVAYLADTAAYDVFRAACGFQLDEATRLDAAIRLVAGRRNIYVYMLLAGVLIGAPAAAFHAIVVWAVITAAAHLARTAVLLRRRPLAPAGELH